MDIAPRILDEAAEWLAQMGSGPLSTQEQDRLARWRRRSPAHAEAWARAERLLDKMTSVPPALAHPALAASQQARRGRRAAVAQLAALLAVAPAGWLGWQSWRLARDHGWTADLRSDTGERREETLADGTRVLLSTASAIDVRFDAAQRLIVLRAGEALVQTAPDPSGTHRPLRVATAEGRLQALGTRFSVRQGAGRTHLAVLDGAVRVEPSSANAAGEAPVVHAGERLSFTPREVSATETLDTASATAWTRGMLLADRMPLGQVAAELERWHPGIVRCDAAVAAIPVSGAFPLTDTDQALSMIVSTYSVDALTRLRGRWITLVPRV